MFKRKEKKLLHQIRQRWGKPAGRKTDISKIALFHDLISAGKPDAYINNTTWEDLNLDSFFRQIDHTVTPAGSQYLFHLLHCYSDIETLKQRTQLYSVFQQDRVFREKLQLLLSPLDQKNIVYLPNLILKELPEKPRFSFVFYLLSFGSFLFPALIYFFPLMLWPTIGLLITNIIINQLYGQRFTTFFVEISGLALLLKTALNLAKIKTHHPLPQLTVLKNQMRPIQSLLKKIGWLTIDKTQLPDITLLLVEYLNQFSLFDLVSYLKSINHIRKNQQSLIELFEAVTSLDALLGVASYLTTVPKYCTPDFNTSGRFEFVNVYHPLLENGVANSITLKKKSVLITGSNMAGKTTFVKTIALNMVFAQTLHICLADEARIPALKVLTSIKRSDDINQHKSYYYQEIEALLEFIRLNENKNQYLFIIDEIFRGTNTMERIASAAAVLQHLSRNNYSFVTTHDIELKDLLEAQFEMYHFSEQVENNRHFFDYRLKPGASTSRNAIKLLEIKGYPKSIVQKANQLTESYINRQTQKQKA